MSPMSSSSSDVPPGLRSGLNLYTAGNHGHADWLVYEEKKHYTNAFIVQGSKILLGYKKRGFGKDMFNGFGGKVEPGETSLEAAKRELEEEAGIQAPLEHIGELLFMLEGENFAFYIDVFRADEYLGAVTETEEMRPQWFRIDDGTVKGDDGDGGTEGGYPPIPYTQMWEDDVYWFPKLLQRQHFAGRADFVRDAEKDKYVIRRWWFGQDEA